MKKISVENFVKTSCGIDQYNSLKKNKSIFGKLRLSWFLFFATIRDLFVSKKINLTFLIFDLFFVRVLSNIFF